MSHTLSHSGVYMGNTLNESGDLIPAQDMYDACRIMARHVKHLGGLKWDFSKLHTMPIDPEFQKKIKSYLASVLESPAAKKGWKIPETTLVYPWIVRMFPEAYYIHWVRDPRDSILGRHLTDNLADFGVAYDKTDDIHLQRAISWAYQAEIIKATPKPKHFVSVKFEDFVLKQPETLKTVGGFLGFDLAAIPVKKEAVGRHFKDNGWKPAEKLLKPYLGETGYNGQKPAKSAGKARSR
jgi:hypothetical protein